MTIRLLTRDVLPFLLKFSGLVVATLAGDALLHLAGLVWVGRYLGIPGTILILVSMLYSARKRRWIERGSPVQWLRWHQWLAWAGAWLVLVHAGIHFRAVLGWLAVGAMLINVGSGLVGRYLLDRGRRTLAEARRELEQQGLTAEEIDTRTYFDVLTLRVVKQWHAVHLPIALAFGVLATAHIIAIFLFWGWK